jgi:hypothetical protein
VTDTEQAPEIPTQIIGGRECTNRAGIARLAGWKPGNTVNVRAGTDPEFPTPIRGQRVGREFWYPLDGDHGVNAYLALLAQRAVDKKPLSVEPGDPNDLLRPDDAADALHIDPATFRSYVRYSVPYWTGQKTGRPLIPPPDEPHGDDATDARVRRKWRRGTLAAHQATRPGPGTGAGRPSGSSQPST